MLVLVRGLPGSGKSTFAQSLAVFGIVHCEADMFFVTDGEYKYDPAKRNEAHSWCQQQARQALQVGQDVVVSNTFTKHWEMEPYLAMAAEFNVKTHVVQMNGEYGSIHNVPEEIVQRMKARWEN